MSDFKFAHFVKTYLNGLICLGQFKMPKRSCKFTEELQNEFPFLQKHLSLATEVRCKKCLGTFSIAHGGRSDIQRHVKSDKHQKSLSAASSSAALPTFFRQDKFGDKEAELAQTEGLWAFHTVTHNQSFRSMDCTSKLIQKVFDKKIQLWQNQMRGGS